MSIAMAPAGGRRGWRDRTLPSPYNEIVVINGVSFPEDKIAEFCRRHGVAKLSLFGSILREATPEGGYGFRPTSDVDMLVEFLPGRTPGLLALSAMQIELTEMIGREVDLRTPMELSRYFRHEVLREARMLHAA
jgi:predicted nucleotidyltransferase